MTLLFSEWKSQGSGWPVILELKYASTVHQKNRPLLVLRGGQSESDDDVWVPPPRQSFTEEQWEEEKKKLLPEEANLDMLVRMSK